MVRSHETLMKAVTLSLMIVDAMRPDHREWFGI